MTPRPAITNEADIIDTRDLLDYMATLDPTRDSSKLAILNDLIVELRDNNSETLEDGIQLVRDNYFTEYARQLAEETGAIPPKLHWPLYCIDWEDAARELKMDYTPIDFWGVRYWYR